MTHLPQLIQDLALILVVAAFVSLSFKKMKQPVVLGYLVAGMLVGPHQTLFPQVSDLDGIGIWADIGLIFLLFAIGLEFSFRKLSRLGAAPGITAVFETAMMLLTGFVTGLALKWPTMDSLFLGALLAISSTTVLIKTFDELGFKGRRFVSLVIGILIFEDLIAVLLMVTLTTIAASREFHGLPLLVQVSRLVFFLALWFMVGVFALPHLAKKIRPLLNAESTMVVSLGLCFMMVVLATKAGFTPALGAFVMGSLLAETSEGERIERVVRSVKDLFSAVFFVSVGMLMNPEILIRHWDLVLVLTAVLIVSKVTYVTLGAVIAGQPGKTAFLSGMSLPQIGEFSYIIAGLGLSLHVISEMLYPLAVAVSVLTAFTTTYMITSSDRIFRWFDKNIYVRTNHKGQYPRRLAPALTKPPTFQNFIKGFCLKMLLHCILIVAIFLAMSEGVLPWAEARFANHPVLIGFLTTSTLILCAPFYWGLAFSKVDGQSFSHLWKKPRPRPFVVFLALLRFGAGVALMSSLISQFLFEQLAIFLVVSMLIVFTMLFYGPLEKIYGFIESVFLNNLADKPASEATLNFFEMPSLAPWDAHLVEFQVPPEADFVGKSLSQLRVRENFGISIALIKRGERRITAPGKNELLMPSDHLFAIGTDDQLLKFKKFLNHERTTREAFALPVDYTLEPFTVALESPLIGQSIRNSGIRETTRGMVVGIERCGQRLLNPDSSMNIEANDILWIVGDRALIRRLEHLLPVDDAPFI